MVYWFEYDGRMRYVANPLSPWRMILDLRDMHYRAWYVPIG